MTDVLEEGSLWRATHVHWLKCQYDDTFDDIQVMENDVVMIVSCNEVVGSLRKCNVKLILGERVYDVADVDIPLWHSYYERVK